MVKSRRFRNSITAMFTLLAASLPFYIFLNNVLLGCLLAASLICVFSKNWHINKSSALLLAVFFFSLFSLMAVSLAYSDNLVYGLKVLGRSSIFVVVPFTVIALREYNSALLRRRIFQGFIAGCLMAAVFTIVVAISRTIEYGAVNPFYESNGNFFSYFRLTEVLKAHPVYLGMQMVFCVAIIGCDFVLAKPVLACRNYIRILLLGFLTIYIFLLSSFLLIINLAVVISLIVFITIKRRAVAYSSLQIIGVVAILALMGVSSSYFLREKFKGVSLYEDLQTLDFSGNHFTAVRARKAKAYCTYQMSIDNLPFGVGIGDSNDRLQFYYKKYGFMHGYEKGYNPHNQYLSYFSSLGVPGLSIFLVLLVWQIILAFRSNDFYLLIITITNSLFFITESALERHSGLLFFVFFSCISSIKRTI